MNSHRTPGKTSALRRLGAVVVLLIAVVAWWTISRRPAPVSPRTLPPQAVSAATNRPATPAVSGIPTNELMASQSVPNYEWFRKRPLGVSRESSNYEWTEEDGKDTNVIRRLAHNDLESERMLKENDTIYRRQLVYHKGAFSLLAQAARLGEPVSRMALPGLDGQELQVEVVKSELEAGGDRGVFTGRLAGRQDSMVTVAFLGGREGFTVISPQDRLYLVAEPREAGEIVVKSIDPDTYGGFLPDNDAVVMPEKK